MFESTTLVLDNKTITVIYTRIVLPQELTA